jgi:translation initiation factor 1A
MDAKTKSRRDIPFADSKDQEYGWVTKMLGDMRVMVQHPVDKTERIGVIRGNMRKRVWIHVGDLVLVTIREFDPNKVDIVFKYTDQEVRTLRKYKEPIGQYASETTGTDDGANEEPIFEDDPDIDDI